MRRHRTPVRSIGAAIVAFVLVAACAPTASPSPIASGAAAQASSAPAESSPPVVSSPPTATSTLPALQPTGSLPVRGSAWEIGVVTSPAPDGQLYVLVGRPDGGVLALLDRAGSHDLAGRSRSPTRLSAEVVLAAADGTVRVLCQEEVPGGGVTTVRAFAFDLNGRPRSGWPIDLACCPDGLIVARVIGDALTVNERELDPELVTSRVTTIAADGTIARGAPATYAHCCQELMAIGPDGVVYRVTPSDDISGETSAELSAIGPAGAVPGFPVSIDGVVSPPAFDDAGRIHLTVGTPTADRHRDRSSPNPRARLDRSRGPRWLRNPRVRRERHLLWHRGNVRAAGGAARRPGWHDVRHRRRVRRHHGGSHQLHRRDLGRLAIPEQ